MFPLRLRGLFSALFAALLMALLDPVAALPPTPTTAAPPALAPHREPGRGSWQHPLSPGSPVVRSFDPPDRRWLPGHRGVDFATRPGDRARSPGPGTVRFTGVVAGRPVVTVEHAGGLTSTLEPVSAEVRPGTRVKAGQVIGTVRDGSHCSDPCLHWGVYRGAGRTKEYLSPLPLLGRDDRPSVLLPVAALLPIARQTIADTPVIARPVTSVLISYVPS